MRRTRPRFCFAESHSHSTKQRARFNPSHPGNYQYNRFTNKEDVAMSSPIKPSSTDDVTTSPADTTTVHEPVNSLDERSWQDASTPPPVTDPPRAMPQVV